MSSHSAYGTSKDPQAIERDIDHIRHRISSTVDTLEHRLSPNHFIDQAIRSVREHGGEAAGNFGSIVKQNPVALLLVGAGVAWLMKGPQRHGGEHDFETRTTRSGVDASAEPWNWPTGGGSSHSRWHDSREAMSEKAHAARDSAMAARDRVGAAASRTGERLREGADSLGQSVRHSLSSAGDRASDLGAAARHRYADARDGFDRLLDEQPLVVGAIGLAIGAAIGGLAPGTRREDRLMGGVRDDLMQQAAGEASSRYEDLRERVSDVARQTSDAFSDAVGQQQPDGVREGDATDRSPAEKSMSNDQSTRRPEPRSNGSTTAGDPPTSAGGTHATSESNGASDGQHTSSNGNGHYSASKQGSSDRFSSGTRSHH